jgi:hypothetical protein
VAIKVGPPIRSSTRRNLPRLQIDIVFFKEVVLWKHLANPNINVPLRCAGIETLQLALDWVRGGKLVEHIRSFPRANRIGLVSCFFPAVLDSMFTLLPVA